MDVRIYKSACKKCSKKVEIRTNTSDCIKVIKCPNAPKGVSCGADITNFHIFDFTKSNSDDYIKITHKTSFSNYRQAINRRVNNFTSVIFEIENLQLIFDTNNL